MKGFDEIGKVELRDLLVKNWMTHDAMWFAHAVQQCGIEKANLVNRAAVKAMAVIEARRLQEAFGLGEVRAFEDLERFMVQSFEVVRGPFMNFQLSFPAENVMRWEISNCFAYQGVTRLGVADDYQCGIFERIDGWLEALGVRHTATPEVHGCLQHQLGRCHREYRFAF